MNIIETTFASRTYLVWRKEVEIKNITDSQMWQSAFGKVYEYIQKNNIKVAGPGTALYFRWDESAGKAELGIGSPVEGISQVKDPGLSLVSVAESKAAKMIVRGGYEQLRGAHAELAQYIAKHNLKPTLTVEEYAVMGMDNPDPKQWETNLYYLHE